MVKTTSGVIFLNIIPLASMALLLELDQVIASLALIHSKQIVQKPTPPNDVVTILQNKSLHFSECKIFIPCCFQWKIIVVELEGCNVSGYSVPCLPNPDAQKGFFFHCDLSMYMLVQVCALYSISSLCQL